MRLEELDSVRDLGPSKAGKHGLLGYHRTLLRL